MLRISASGISGQALWWCVKIQHRWLPEPTIMFTGDLSECLKYAREFERSNLFTELQDRKLLK